MLRELGGKFGSRWKQLRKVVARRFEGDKSEDFYSLKNADLGLSLAVGGFYAGGVSQKFLKHFEPSAIPESLLDVGCENGLLTCYYGLLYPKARIVGIDPCGAAIRQAEVLRTSLNIRNVEFLKGELPHAMETQDRFDVIVAVTVFQDAEIFPHFGDESALGFTLPSPVSELKELHALRGVLSANGEFFSFERCAYPAQLAWWIQTAIATGWEIDWGKSRRLDCAPSYDAPNQITLACFRPNDARQTITEEEIRSLWLSGLYPRQDESDTWFLQNEAARAFRRSVVVKEKLCEAKTQNVGELEILEICTTGPFIFFYAENGDGRAFFRWGASIHEAAFRTEWQTAADILRSRVGSEFVHVETRRQATKLRGDEPGPAAR